MCKECCIVGAGPSPIYIRRGAFVIAADGGLEKLNKAGISPDLVMGDFDSLASPPKGDNVLTFPKDKNDTDTLLAIKEALGRGYEKIFISGGVGGRLDHTIANIQSLIFANKLGAEAYLCGDGETVTVINGRKAEFSETCRGYISVFSLNENAVGVNIEGLKYSVSGASLSNMFPIGVSNEFVGKKAVVSAENGMLSLIWQGLPDDVTII